MEGAPENEDKALQAAQIVHKTYDELEDFVGAKYETVENLIERTRVMAEAPDEEWMQHYDALMNLRSLAKYHFQAMIAECLDQWSAKFVAQQAKNLRSHNSRNSMQLFMELFTQNNEGYEFKSNQTWALFVDQVLPAVFSRVGADKQFLVNVAKRGVTACAENCHCPETASNIITNIASKNLALAEFSVGALNSFVKYVQASYYEEQKESSLHIVNTLTKVIESKKLRMVKHATPAMLHIKQTIGADRLKSLIIETMAQETKAQCPQHADEEAKVDASAAQKLQADFEKRADRIMSSLEPQKKKADKSLGFRSFLKTQKNDLKDMLIVEDPKKKTSESFAGTLKLQTGSHLAPLIEKQKSPHKSNSVINYDQVSQAHGDDQMVSATNPDSFVEVTVVDDKAVSVSDNNPEVDNLPQVVDVDLEPSK